MTKDTQKITLTDSLQPGMFHETSKDEKRKSKDFLFSQNKKKKKDMEMIKIQDKQNELYAFCSCGV